MKRINVIYFVLIASFLLLIYDIYHLDYTNISKGPFSGIVSSTLLIVSMILAIRDIKKAE